MSSPIATRPIWLQYEDVRDQRLAYAEYQRANGVEYQQSLVDAARLLPAGRGPRYGECTDKLPTIDTSDVVARDQPSCVRCSRLPSFKLNGEVGTLCQHHRESASVRSKRHYQKKKAAKAALKNGTGFNEAVLQHMKYKHGYDGMPFVAGKAL